VTYKVGDRVMAQVWHPTKMGVTEVLGRVTHVTPYMVNVEFEQKQGPIVGRTYAQGYARDLRPLSVLERMAAIL
jgi:hypothetical protein